jgi:hypothetical protein
MIDKDPVAGNDARIRAAELHGQLRVAGVAHTSPQVDIVDLQTRRPSLGARFLRQYAVTFDVAEDAMNRSSIQPLRAPATFGEPLDALP